MAQEPFQVKVTGHGRPMILIPGLSSSGEVWDTTVARYKDRFECHVLTVAGFAGVPRVPAPMLDRVRDGLADYIRKQKLDHPVVIGHSLGGFLALSLAAKYPDLPGRLVIVDSYPFFAALANPQATPDSARASAARADLSGRIGFTGEKREELMRVKSADIHVRADDDGAGRGGGIVGAGRGCGGRGAGRGGIRPRDPRQ